MLLSPLDNDVKMSEYVIIVDDQDREVGQAEKLLVHLTSRLHRAFSVFVFDAAGRMLLQRRARDKYHSGGLWSNTCCGHPRPGESAVVAAERRLQEEMGFSCKLTPACTVRYHLELGGGLAEHEYDHVFVGVFEGSPVPDPGEVHDWCWIDRHSLQEALRRRPGEFTRWFSVILEQLEPSLLGRLAGVAQW
jgi:isopentenyl-diphosphate delta-isomerase